MIRMFLMPLCMAIAICVPHVVGQESQTATWKGTLNAGGTKLRLEIDIIETEGKFSGELRSLDQGNAKLKVTEIKLADKKLSFSINQIGAKFSGKLTKKGTVAKGTFTQGPAKLPLELSRFDLEAAAPKKESKEKLKEAWVGELNLGLMKPVMQF